MCGWKPVLVFSKGRKKMRFSAYDVLESKQMEKHSHKWQQSESGVEKLIEIFSEPGQLIVDPFAGSGTFLKVAKDLSRNAIGAEIN
jgi:DNA modification methylase